MKKVLFSLLALLAMLASVNHAKGQGQFAIGVKGGLNFASVDISQPGATYESRTGYHAGAFALFKFTKIGLQPEIIFSQQGSKVKISGDNFKSNFSYMNIPIILKLYTIAGINLQAGPQFGFLTKAEFNDQNIKDELKKSDTSLALGVGWDTPINITLDVRYNLGLSDISDDIPYEMKNQVWQVSAGFKLIKLGK